MALVLHPVQQRGDDRGQLRVLHAPVAGAGHGRDDRVDPTALVRPAGGGVVVGGVDQRLDRDRDRLGGVQTRPASASSSVVRENSEPDPTLWCSRSSYRPPVTS